MLGRGFKTLPADLQKAMKKVGLDFDQGKTPGVADVILIIMIIWYWSSKSRDSGVGALGDMLELFDVCRVFFLDRGDVDQPAKPISAGAKNRKRGRVVERDHAPFFRTGQVLPPPIFLAAW